MQPAQSNRASRIHRTNNVACARFGFNRAQLPRTGNCRLSRGTDTLRSHAHIAQILSKCVSRIRRPVVQIIGLCLRSGWPRTL
jgi:hypothetical protein